MEIEEFNGSIDNIVWREKRALADTFIKRVRIPGAACISLKNIANAADNSPKYYKGKQNKYKIA